ncbi:MAG: family 10 glycosylhydrolase, partial [Ignavibacteriales bacterium]|nr:family 10 glycosylhydrolase [Ignavibacteriales bacterium]
MKKFALIFFSFISFNIYSQLLEEFRGVKLTNVDSQILFTDDNIAAGMDFLSSKGINAVLTVCWNGGWTLYPSQVMDSLFGKEIHSSFTGRDPLKRVIIEAHRNGIEVYPWFEYGFAAWYSGGTSPFGGHILQTFPDWASRNYDGSITTENGFDWMQAINP